MTELHGKNVVVTGASRGIGVYIARALAERGANLALIARDAAALERVARELGKKVRAIPFSADLKHTASYPGLIDRIESELGPVDVLVNKPPSSRTTHSPTALRNTSPSSFKST